MFDKTTSLQIISDILTAPDFDKIISQFLELHVHASHQKSLNGLTSSLTPDQIKLLIDSTTLADYEQKSEKLRLIDWYFDTIKKETEAVGNAPQFLKSTYADISRLIWNLAESFYESHSK